MVKNFIFLISPIPDLEPSICYAVGTGALSPGIFAEKQTNK
jgi:hypothetical protein